MLQRKHRTMAILFLSPAILSYILMFLYPTVRTAIMTFFDVPFVTSDVSDWTFNGLSNYREIFSDGLFIQSLKNMGSIWFFGGIFVLTIALLFATLLSTDIKGKSLFKTILYMPNIISAVALGTMWMQYIYSAQYGLLKNVFTFLNMEQLATIKWTGAEHLFASMLIAFSFGIVGYYMLIFLSGIDAIPTELSESAKIDGAGHAKTFFYIILPLLKGTIKTVLTLWSVTVIGFFVWTKVFSPLTVDLETITPMIYVYEKAFSNIDATTVVDPGAAAAACIILSIITVIVFLIVNSLVKEKDV